MIKKILNSAMLMTWARDFVRIGTPLFVVPLVLAFYSDEEQTFYFWIQILAAFAIIADAGISSVLVRATSYFLAGATDIPKNKKEFDEAEGFSNRPPNKEGLAELFQTTKWIYLLVCIFAFLLLSTGGIANFWNLMEQTGHRQDMWGAYGFLVIYLILYLVNVRFSSFMRGLDFVANEARMVTVTTAVRLIIWILLLSLKVKPFGLTFVLVLEAIAQNIFYRRFLRNWFIQNQITLQKKTPFNKELFMSIWPAAWRMGGIQLGNFFVERGNNILILQIQDTAMMANFTFTTWILKTVFAFSLTPVYSRLPVLFKFAAEKKFDSLKKSAAGYMFIGLTIIVFVYIIIGLFGNTVLDMAQVDRQIIYPIALFAIMALTEILDLHSSFHAGVYTSTNHIPFFWPSVISGAIIFFAGLYYALPAHGLVGIIVTRFIIQLCFNNWYAMFLNLRFLNWPAFQFIKDVPTEGIKYIFEKVKHLLNKTH